MTLNVCLAGATGWAGSELARGIAAAGDMTLASAISRTHAGGNLAQALGSDALDVPVFATVAEALAQPCDVLVEYTHPDMARANILAALEHGAHVVVGTSGSPMRITPTSTRRPARKGWVCWPAAISRSPRCC